MDANALNGLREQARERLPEALVALFLGLAASKPLREACAQWSVDATRHAELRERIVVTLDNAAHHTKLAEEQAFALLDALGILLDRRDKVPAVIRATHSDGSTWYVVPRRKGWRSHLASQPDKPQRWLPNWWVVPGQHQGLNITVFNSRSRRTQDILRACVQSGALRVAIASFVDAQNPVLTKTGTHFHFTHLRDVAARQQAAERALALADEAGAHVLVLPELTMPSELRAAACKWLRQRASKTLCLVVPGSFHEIHAGQRCNRTQLVNADGGLRVHHDKLSALSFRQGEVELLEEITTGTSVRLVQTPVGLVGIPICRDFLDLGPPFDTLWDAVGLGLALVPSMGDDRAMRAHALRADALSKSQQTLVGIANEPPPIPDLPVPDLGAAMCAKGKICKLTARGTGLQIETFVLDLVV